MKWRNKFIAGSTLATVLWLILSPRVAQKYYIELLLLSRIRRKLKLIVENLRLEHRVISFPSGNQLLTGYLIGSGETLVVYYGGRGSNLLLNFERAECFLKAGVSVFVFDYRGFGINDGVASLKTVFEDGLAAYDAAASQGYRDIVIYGESLGASIASHVSSKRDAHALILQSGFSSLEKQAKDSIPFLHLYPKFMFPKSGLDTEVTLRSGHPPLLILHGDADERVSVKHAMRIYKAAPGSKRLVTLPNVGHKDVFLTWRWQQVVRSFLAGLRVTKYLEWPVNTDF